jgi:hypothetical protein
VLWLFWWSGVLQLVNAGSIFAQRWIRVLVVVEARKLGLCQSPKVLDDRCLLLDVELRKFSPIPQAEAREFASANVELYCGSLRD